MTHDHDHDEEVTIAIGVQFNDEDEARSIAFGGDNLGILLEMFDHSVTPADPTTTLLSNLDGQPVTSGADALAKLVAQMTRPVRWDLCQERLAGLGVTGILELAPGGVLTGLARRTLPDVARLAIKGPDDIDAARAFVAEHAAARG